MTACATPSSLTPHPDRVPPARPPPASGSRAGRPRRRGPAPQPLPEPTAPRSRPRRRGGGRDPVPPPSPEVGKVDAMPDGDLRQPAWVEETSIGFTRPDGSTGATPVWVVQAGDAVVVRSIRGPVCR